MGDEVWKLWLWGERLVDRVEVVCVELGLPNVCENEAEKCEESHFCALVRQEPF